MTVELAQRYYLSPSDVRWFGVDFTDDLGSTDTLSTVTVTEVGTTILTIASEAVNAGSTQILGRTVSASKGVFFKVSGQTTSPSPYRVRVNVTTSSGETIVRDALFECK